MAHLYYDPKVHDWAGPASKSFLSTFLAVYGMKQQKAQLDLKEKQQKIDTIQTDFKNNSAMYEIADTHEAKKAIWEKMATNMGDLNDYGVSTWNKDQIADFGSKLTHGAEDAKAFKSVNKIILGIDNGKIKPELGMATIRATVDAYASTLYKKGNEKRLSSMLEQGKQATKVRLVTPGQGPEGQPISPSVGRLSQFQALGGDAGKISKLYPGMGEGEKPAKITYKTLGGNIYKLQGDKSSLVQKGSIEERSVMNAMREPDWQYADEIEQLNMIDKHKRFLTGKPKPSAKDEERDMAAAAIAAGQNPQKVKDMYKKRTGKDY